MKTSKRDSFHIQETEIIKPASNQQRSKATTGKILMICACIKLIYENSETNSE